MRMRPAAQRGPLPAVDEQAREPRGVGVGRQVPCRARLLETGPRARGDLREAVLDAQPGDRMRARELLSEAAEETAEVTLALVRLLRHLEEEAHAPERRTVGRAQAGVEPRMHSHHVPVDDLEGEVLLVREVMVERTLGRWRGVEQPGSPMRSTAAFAPDLI